MERLNKRDRQEGGGRDNKKCARELKTVQEDSCDGCSKETSLDFTCLVVLIIMLKSFELVVVYNTIIVCGIQCVIAP